MNLEFQIIQDMPDYTIQRADVTQCRDFWINWKMLPKDHPLHLFVTLRSENGRWFAFRKVPKNDTPIAAFTLNYSVRDTRNLLPYQPLAVAHICNSIIRHNAACDGSDTGTGKTYVGLAVARELYLQPAIICKKAGIGGWKRACRYMGIAPLFIINWELARTAKFRFLQRQRDPYDGKYTYFWHLPDKTLLIFDEAHMGCNEDSQNHALWVAAAAYPTLSCSATFADRPSRLRGLFSVLKIMKKEDFNSWLQKQGHFVNKYNQMESLCATQDMKRINKIIYPDYGYRLSWTDPEVRKCFPDVVIHTHILSIGAKETAAENKLFSETMQKVDYYKSLGKTAEALVAELRFRQAAELLKAASLTELVNEYLFSGLSVCVFVNFRETLAYLAKSLKTKSLIFGDQDKFHINREEVIADFQKNKSRLIVSMIAAGGASIDLHDLQGGHQRVSLICPTYDPIAVKQVMGRTHRSGAKSVPIIKLVYAADTIEEKVADVVNKKLDSIEALNKGDLMEPDLFQLRGAEK